MRMNICVSALVERSNPREHEVYSEDRVIRLYSHTFLEKSRKRQSLAASNTFEKSSTPMHFIQT